MIRYKATALCRLFCARLASTSKAALEAVNFGPIPAVDYIGKDWPAMETGSHGY
jgi:hypothetical protein